MWKMERAWPFYLLAGFYALAFHIIPWLSNFGLVSGFNLASIDNAQLYYKSCNWLTNILSLWASMFYLKHNRFEGDQFRAILISLGLNLFLPELAEILLGKNMWQHFPNLYLSFRLIALLVVFFYWKRHQHKEKKTRHDILKLRLVIAFVITEAIMYFVWKAPIISPTLIGVFSKTPPFIALVFFLVHLKHLQLKEKEDGEDHFAKLIDDFGKSTED